MSPEERDGETPPGTGLDTRPRTAEEAGSAGLTASRPLGVFAGEPYDNPRTPAARRRGSGSGGVRKQALLGKVLGLTAGLLLTVAALSASDVQAQTATTFVSNLGSTGSGGSFVTVGAGADEDARKRAQSFTTGTHSAGYVLTEVKINIFVLIDADSVTPNVSIYTADSQGLPDTLLHALTTPSGFGAGEQSFAAPANAMLDANTTYFVVFDETDDTASGQFWLTGTSSTAEDAGGQAGWSIGDTFYDKDPRKTFWEEVSNSGILEIEVRGNAVMDGEASTDATLSGLTLSGVTLSPGFASTTSTYTGTAAHAVSQTTVTPTLNDANASLAYLDGDDMALADADPNTDGHQVDLDVGENVIRVKVTAEDTTTVRTYQVTVTRASANASTDATLSDLTLSGVTLNPGFASTTSTYTGTVAHGVSRTTVTPTPNDSNASLVYLDRHDMPLADADPNSDGQQVLLSVGENVIKVKVTAEDAATERTYQVTVTRAAASTDATLSGLNLPGVTLSPGFAPMTFDYAATVPSYVTRITLRPEASRGGATLAIVDADDAPIADADSNTNGHQIDLIAGDNVVRVEVTSEDGVNSRTYTLTVTRRAQPRITVRPRYPNFGAGLEAVQLHLLREDPTTDAVTVTVNVAQEHAWLSSTRLTHQVTFGAGARRAILNLSASWFSLDVPTSGGLTASVAPVAGYDVSQSAATVQMISIPDKPVTVELDKSAYRFDENGGPDDVGIYAVFTVDAVFPRPPAGFGAIDVSTGPDTASGSEDYEPLTYGLAQFFTRDFVLEDGRYVARILVGPSPGNPIAILDDEVYEGIETFHVKIGAGFSSPGYLRYKRADGTFCESTCAGIAYPVTIVDEEDRPELSLSVSPPIIDEEDDSDTASVTENASRVTASITNGKSFAADQTITLSFGGTATAGTHYAVTPADSDGNTTGHQVTLAAGDSTVAVTLTAAGNSAANAARTITVAGSHDGTNFGTTQTVTINDNDGSNNLPIFASTTATRSFVETVGDSAAQSATNIGAALPAASDDDEDTLTYSLEGADAASFGFDASTRQLKTKTGTVYDYESKSSYSVTVKADDGNGGTAATRVTVNLTNASEVPVAPTAPTVTRVTGDPTRLEVSWTAPGNGGRPAIVSYDLRYKEASQTDWTDGPQDQTGGSVSVAGLIKDREYEVQLRASNADGDGPWSSSGTGTTDSNTAPTYSPESVPISFTETVADSVGTGKIDLSRHPASDNDGDTLTYTLEGPDSDRFTVDPASAHLETKVGQVFDYEEQPQYLVVVKADDGNGGMATLAVVVSLFDAVEVPLAPPPPTVTGGPLRVDVSWSAPSSIGRPAATSYDLRYRKMSDPTWTDGPNGVTDTRASIGNLAIDTEYRVQVRAVNKDGKGVWSASGGARTVDKPGVTGLRATGSADRVDLSWTAPAGTILGYRIEVSHDRGFNWAVVEADTTATDTHYTHHSGLAAGEIRHYRVSAITDQGTIPASEWAEVDATVEVAGLIATGLPPQAGPNGSPAIDLCWLPGGANVEALSDFALRKKRAHPGDPESWGTQVWSPLGKPTVDSCTDGVGFRVFGSVVPNTRYAFQLRARHGSGWALSNTAEGVSVDTARVLRTDIAAGDSDLSGDTPVPETVCPAYDDPVTPENEAGTFIVNIGFTTKHPALLSYEEVRGFDVATDVRLENATAELVEQPYHNLLGYRVRITPTTWGQDVTVSVPAGAVTHAASLIENQASPVFRRATSTATSCESEANPEPRIRRADILGDDGTDGEWTPGDRIRIILYFTEEMTVSTENGVPTVSLRLQGNAPAVPAAYVGAGYSGSDLVFEHHVAAVQDRVRRAELLASSLALNGGEIASSFGVPAKLAHSGVVKRIRPLPGTQLTAAWTNVSHVHSGNGSTFSVGLQFSRPVAISRSELRDHALSVSGGAIDNLWRVKNPDGTRRNDLWAMRVAPSSELPVTLTLNSGRDCSQQGAVCTADGRPLYGRASVKVFGATASVSVADAEVQEGVGAELAFAVTLDGPAPYRITVDYMTSDVTATAGQDYTAVEGRLVFRPGEDTKTVRVPVLDDAHDEGSETLKLTLHNPKRVIIADGEATGIITNADLMPQAWLARFGRTVAEQIVDAVGDRLRGPPAPGVQATLAGERIGPGAGAGAAEAEDDEEARWKALEDPGSWSGAGPEDAGRRAGYRSVEPRELLTGSSFQLAVKADGAGAGIAALWGRGAWSSFDGRDGDLSLSGEVTSAFIGADWTREKRTAGLMLSHARGQGSYRGASAGKVESTVTGLYPYGRYAASDRVTLWGTAGYGAGTLTLKPDGGKALGTDMDLMMTAAGLRGTVLQAPPEGGPELAVETDALAVRTRSEALRSPDGNLAAAIGDATRLRLSLHGSWRGIDLAGGALEPRLELGLRRDGGDAETGFGLDAGTGFAWNHPENGLRLQLSGRGLLTHESKGFREQGVASSLAWQPHPERGRGPKLTLTQTMGGAASGGAGALLGRRTLEGLAANDDANPLESRSLDMRFGYGFPAFGDRFTAAPEIGFGMSSGHREYSLAWPLVRDMRGDAGALELALEASRREAAGAGADGAPPEHAAGFRITARW